ncbi:TPA: hypothetical protein EYP12_05580 [Candidatus Bipolaricaulota bacterium]|nr:hypothetical protein [Candidatus Bipolaricaulota bacterium]
MKDIKTRAEMRTKLISLAVGLFLLLWLGLRLISSPPAPGLGLGIWRDRAGPSSDQERSTPAVLVQVRSEEGPYVLSEPQLKRVVLRSSWTNTGPEAIENLRIYVGVPMELPEQDLMEVVWSPEPTAYLEDRYGQRIAEFSLGRLEPGRTVTIGLTVVGRFWQIRYNLKPERVGPLGEIPEEIIEAYTADGPYYRLDDPLIAATAERVVGEEENPYLMALKIHDFVAGSLEYDLDGKWDDAPTVLRRGSGSCSEFVFLFIALARAVGLPARYAGGSIYIPSQARRGTFIDRYHHRWVEVYLPGYGWVPFDPTWDHRGPGRPVSHEYVGSHGYALVFVRGDMDERYLGINYIDSADTGRGTDGEGPLRQEREVVWSNP